MIRSGSWIRLKSSGVTRIPETARVHGTLVSLLEEVNLEYAQKCLPNALAGRGSLIDNPRDGCLVVYSDSGTPDKALYHGVFFDDYVYSLWLDKSSEKNLIKYQYQDVPAEVQGYEINEVNFLRDTKTEDAIRTL